MKEIETRRSNEILKDTKEVIRLIKSKKKTIQ